MESRCELEGWDAGRKIETNLGAVFLSRRKRLNITDEEQFIEAFRGTPFEAQTLKIDVKINRSEVTKALKGSNESLVETLQSDGASLEEYSTITFK